MSDYTVSVDFHIEADTPEQARHAIEQALHKHLPGGYGFDIEDVHRQLEPGEIPVLEPITTEVRQLDPNLWPAGTLDNDPED